MTSRAWDDSEDQRLLRDWDAGSSVPVLAHRHARSIGAIRARLRMLRGDDFLSSEADRASSPDPRVPADRQPLLKAIPGRGGPPKPSTTKVGRPRSEGAERARLREAELDRLWELKKARTREERSRLSRQAAGSEARQRAQEETQTRARLSEERRRQRDSQLQQAASSEAERQRHEKERLSRPRLPSNTSPPDPLPRSSPVTCIHNLPRDNCAHCTPRFLPPIRFRRW